MRQSALFTKTRREAPKDEVAKNAQLLIRAGFVNKEMAGVYDYLPLGLRTFNNIVQIIREEMDSIGGQEVVMSALQRKELWQITDRWDEAKVDSWFKTNLRQDSDVDGARAKELGLGFTHEEPVTNMMEQFVSSYKDLPKYVYQFQTKFRNEARAKSGIMRSREFVMKDLYSFSTDESEFRIFYEECAKAYARIFERAGIGAHTYRTFASGGSFSRFSDEFQTICEAGEDTIYVHEEKRIAINKEVYEDTVLKELGLSKDELIEKKAIEVGNIFPLGTRFSDVLGLTYKNEEGKDVPVVMGSYGIGPGRLMGTIVELLSDDKGIVWPKEVAPFRLHLLCLTPDDAESVKFADSLYEDLKKTGASVLYDDRGARAGEKLTDSDLIGIPTRIIVGKDTLKSKEVEVVDRATGAVQKLTREAVLSL
jgi:prolyl-tRNA synthetase